jgi:hypothetical protein
MVTGQPWEDTSKVNALPDALAGQVFEQTKLIDAVADALEGIGRAAARANAMPAQQDIVKLAQELRDIGLDLLEVLVDNGFVAETYHSPESQTHSSDAGGAF